jgi:hypothetical protein
MKSSYRNCPIIINNYATVNSYVVFNMSIITVLEFSHTSCFVPLPRLGVGGTFVQYVYKEINYLLCINILKTAFMLAGLKDNQQ